MNQAEKRMYLIKKLLEEQPQYRNTAVSSDTTEQKRLLRSLFNIRRPSPVDEEFKQIQSEYLQEETKKKGIIDIGGLNPVKDYIYLWLGDITALKVDAIVNAANSGMTGCYCPCHGCIDNAIHTYAGTELRLKCAEIMERQGYPEPVGCAKITDAYNLPCNFILHTVGPIVGESLTEIDEELLAKCYCSCLALADENQLSDIAFCCISTGEFHFPNYRAAEIAIKTVQEYKAKTNSKIGVIFNVFMDTDYKIYKELLGAN